MRLPPELGREREGAAAARLALHRDRAAHELDQAGGNGQSQAGAAIPPRGRSVLLLERPEDLLLLVQRDADAGVAYREAQSAKRGARSAGKVLLFIGRSALCARALHGDDDLAV